ncbi:MAG: glycosyltransferase family 1 protein [Planctomycetota bacterium]
MRVLVNALSVTNQSGRHVLMGHLNQLSEWVAGEHEFVVLHHGLNEDIVQDSPAFSWVRCPDATARWLGRSLWEYRNLNSVAEKQQCRVVFTPAGVAVPGIKVPQVVLCQNPWCLVPGLHHSLSDKLKAAIQRRAYRRTMKHADLMVFNSKFMQKAYEQITGGPARESIIAYQGLTSETWEKASQLGKSNREDGLIVSVSAMAPHKGADVLVKALRRVVDRGFDARLILAGGWPDEPYRRLVESTVVEQGLSDRVEFSGWISDGQLHELYSRAHVFCLLSRCESFGIPAVEAQSFGTPAIGTTACAIPEIGGDGGLYSKVDDVDGAADNLLRALTDCPMWDQLSAEAIKNANRFRWEACSRPLLKMFELAC